MKQDVIEEISSIISTQLEKKLWGIRITDSQVGKMPRFLVTDYRAFGLIIGLIKYHIKRNNLPDSVFLRGQTKEWPLRSSLSRYVKEEQTNTLRNGAPIKQLNKKRVTLIESWYRKVSDVLVQTKFDFAGTAHEREAMAQHYGLSTQYIDIVDHLQTALWFAYDTQNADALPHDVGYIYIIAISNEDAEIIDLRKKPSDFLRPHIQQALCFRMNKSVEYGKISKENHIMTLVVPRELLYLWSNYATIKESHIYPTAAYDDGQNFWAKVEKELQNRGLGINPEEWVESQIPKEYRVYLHSSIG